MMNESHVRGDLADVYRLLARFGWDDVIHTHASARIPERPGELLINRYGDLFSEVTPDLLTVIDHDGAQLRGRQDPLNTAGIVIHTAVHVARPDAACVIHTHTVAGVAVSCIETGLLPLNQIALSFHNAIAFHDFEGVALDRDEQARLVRDLGKRKVLILRNHGLMTVGSSVAEAFSLMYHLERACQIQVAAMSMNQPLHMPLAEVQAKTARQLRADDDGALALEWAAFKRLANS